DDPLLQNSLFREQVFNPHAVKRHIARYDWIVRVYDDRIVFGITPASSYRKLADLRKILRKNLARRFTRDQSLGEVGRLHQNTTTLRMLSPLCIRSNASLMRSSGSLCVI